MSKLLITEENREDLVLEIKKYPAIWNLEYDTYHLKDARNRAWVKVANALDCTVEECKTQWKYIKEKFRREDARMQGLKPNGVAIRNRWKLLDAMSFIRPFIKPMNERVQVNQVVENESLGFPTSNIKSSYSDSNSNPAEEFENPSNFPSFVINIPEAQTQAENMGNLTPLTNLTPTMPQENYSNKRKFPEPFPSSSVPTAIFPEKKLKQEEDFAVTATYSFYRNMADEALKLSSLDRLKLQVAVIQLHIDAIEKQKSNTNNENKNKTNENNSQ